MKCNSNVSIAVLAGIVVGPLRGAGTSQYAYVVASSYHPNDAKAGAVESYHAAPSGAVKYSNTRALRLNLDQGINDGAFHYRSHDVTGRERPAFDDSKYSEVRGCVGTSGKRRASCESGNYVN